MQRLHAERGLSGGWFRQEEPHGEHANEQNGGITPALFGGMEPSFAPQPRFKGAKLPLTFLHVGLRFVEQQQGVGFYLCHDCRAQSLVVLCFFQQGCPLLWREFPLQIGDNLFVSVRHCLHVIRT